MAAPAEARVRAHEIFAGSGNIATDKTIAGQLCREGFGIYTPQCIGTWRRRNRWAEVAPRAKQMAALGEEMRQAIQVRTPDDLDRVEQAAVLMSLTGERMVALGERLADHILSQVGNIKIETREDLESVIRSVEMLARSTTDFVKSQLVVGKTLQDLRLLRVSSNFRDDGAATGEVIPPDRRRPENEPPPGTMSEQARVISNFADC